MNQSLRARVNPKPAAARVAGHFGELAQGLDGPDGPVALVTLPCPVLVTEVRFEPEPGSVRAAEPVSEKACRAAAATLARLGTEGWGGRLAIARPCPPGLGAGTSTAETLGAVRAVARAFGARLAAEEEAALCLAAEGAVDPLMHAGAGVLFASREGRVIRRLPPLPPVAIAGGFLGPARDTDPADGRFQDASGVFAELEAALRDGDAARLGRAATRSAALNQARQPVPGFEDLRSEADRLGAHGLAVSHTGAAVAVLMPAGADLAAAAAALAASGARDVIRWRLP